MVIVWLIFPFKGYCSYSKMWPKLNRNSQVTRVNVYVTFVSKWECVLCVLLRPEGGYSCPMHQEVRYKWTEFRSFSRRLKEPSCWAHAGQDGPRPETRICPLSLGHTLLASTQPFGPRKPNSSTTHTHPRTDKHVHVNSSSVSCWCLLARRPG